MHIVTILGSLRRNGNTEHTLEAAIDRLRALDEGLTVTAVRLSEVEIGRCRGCRRCFDLGEQACPLHDDLFEIYRAILDSDGVIFASPVYVNDVSGAMKNLIDRLAFVCHRPAFMKVPFGLIVTAGTNAKKHALRSLQAAAISWGAPLCSWVGLNTGALMKPETIEERFAAKLDAFARRFHRFVSRKSFLRPGLIALVVFAVQKRAWRIIAERDEREGVAETTDAKYWREAGWFDPGRTFYFEHGRKGPVLWLARLVGAVATMFFCA